MPQDTIQAEFGITEKTTFALTTSLLPVGGLLGSLILAPWLVNLLGRRGFLLASAPIFITAGGLMTASWWVKESSGTAAFGLLLAGRFLAGIGVGGGSVVAPMYVSEIAPVRFRGAFGSAVQFAVTAGILVVEGLGVVFKRDWVWLFIISTALGVAQAFFSLFIVRSPAFLAARGQRADAEDIVCGLHAIGPDDARAVVEGLSSSRSAGGDRSSPSLLALLRSPVYFFPLVLCMILQVAQQLSGINAVFFFSTHVFDAAGIDATTGSLVAAGVNIAATGLAVAIVDSAGRRLMLLLSTAGMMLAAGGLTACLVLLDAGDKSLATPAIVCVALYVLFFELGLGPIPWMIGAEFFPERPRATAMSAAAAVNYIFTFVVAQGFGAMQEALQNWSFLPFAGVLAVMLVYFLLVLPETKDRRPGEILKAMGIDISSEPDLLAEGDDQDDYDHHSDLDKALIMTDDFVPGRGAVNPGRTYTGSESAHSDPYFGDA